MSTLYIRDVPDDVTAVLKERAAASGMSLSAYVGAQLVALAERPTNAEVAERLRARHRTGGVGVDEVHRILDETRR